MMKKHGLLIRRLTTWLLTLLLLLQLFPSVPITAAGEGASNIDLTARIIGGTSDAAITSVDSGDAFRVMADYTPYPNSGSAPYNAPTITINIPAGIEVRQDDLIWQNNTDVVSASLVPTGSGGQMAMFLLKNALTAGNSRSVGVMLRFPNMTTENGSSAHFQIQMTGEYETSPDSGNYDDFFKETSVDISAVASDTWTVTKSVDPSYTGDASDTDYYYVRYQITANLAQTPDRPGRLSLEQFSLTDTLPTENVQPEGGAIFVSATWPDGTPLDSSSYSLSQTGQFLDAVTFTEYRTMGREGNYVSSSAPITTTYYLNVKYPKAPYLSQANEDLTRYTLTNGAELSYKLLGKQPAADSATAPVEVGWYETGMTAYGFTILKKLEIGMEAFTLTDTLAAEYGQAGFTLYTDAACSVPARNLNNEPIGEQFTGVDGKVLFSNLRYGTYYLKETTVPEGFDGLAAPITVTIGDDGSVTASGGDLTGTQLTLLNGGRTGGKGIVEFYKKGIGAASDTVTPLSGVTFALKKDGATVAEAISNAQGFVRFHAVPAGTYELTETGLGSLDGEYQLPAKTWTVTVQGNDIVQVDFGADSVFGEPNSLLNRSNKGRFQLFKTDSRPEVTDKLAGARFELYDEEPTSVSTPIDTFTVPAAGYVSDALDQGTYWLKEIAAPEGYILDGTPFSIEVVQNATAQINRPNVKYATLGLLKYGSWNSDPYFAGIGGVEFYIYDAPTGGDPVVPDPLISTVDSTGNPYYRHADGSLSTGGILLPAGTYYLEEVPSSVPAEYAPLTERIEVVLNVGNLTEIKVTNAAKYGRFEITKINRRTGASMNGITFEIYDNEACTGTPVDTIVTGEVVDRDAQGGETTRQGVARSKLLPTDVTYYVKEIAPSGYFGVLDIIKGVDGSGHATAAGSGFRLSANTPVAISVLNDPPVSIKIVKTDAASSSKYVSGATFALYDVNPEETAGAAAIQTKTTGANGEILFAGLEPGKIYWYKETAAPSGYVPDPAVHEVTAPAADSVNDVKTENITNQHYATLKIVKNSTFDNRTIALSGAEFRVYPRTSGTSSAAEDLAASAPADIRTVTTGSTGAATIADLAPGAYWVEETRAPDGFTPSDTPVAVEVKSGDNLAGYRTITHATVINDPAKGKLQLKKVDASDSSKNLAATFSVYGPAVGGAYGDTPAVTLTTSSINGLATSGYLDPGVYKIVETAAAEGYVLDAAPFYMTVEAGHTTETIDGKSDNVVKNTPKGELKIMKEATWMGTGGSNGDFTLGLGGAKFDIYPKSSRAPEDRTADKADAVAAGTRIQVTTANDGTVTVPLDPGTYWVEETEAPTGYDMPDNPVQQVTIVTKAVEEITVDNTPQTGRIRILKRDVNGGGPLDSAHFEVYRSDAAGTVQPGLPGVPLVKVDVTNLVSGTESDSSGGVLHGFALSGALPEGTYYLKELASSPLLTQHGYEMVSEWTGPIEVTAGAIAFRDDIYNFKPTSVSGTKLEQDGVTPVANAYIALFADQDEASAMNATLAGGAITAADLTPEYLADNNILQVAKSNNVGVFEFRDLQPGATYYVLEIIAPADYVRNENIYPVTVKEDGTGFTAPLVILDDHYGKVRVKKTTTLTLEDGGTVTYPVDGAEFTLYYAEKKPGAGSADSGNHPCSGSCDYIATDRVAYEATTGTETVEKGTFLTDYLAPGHYILVETKAAEGFEPITTTYHVVVPVDDTNTFYYDNPIENTALYGRFQLRKHDASDPAGGPYTLLAATFQVEKWDEAAGAFVPYPSGDAPYQFTTKTSEIYLSDYLPQGRYQLREITPPSGYTAIDPVEITITGGLVNSVLDVPNAKQGSVVVEKKGSWMGTAGDAMNGVTIGLFAYTGDANREIDCSAAPLQQKSTKNGSVTFTGVNAGTYWVKETAVGSNPGYSANLPAVKVAVSAGATVRLTGSNALVNEPVYGRLKLMKLDRNGGAPIEGVRFDVYTTADCSGAAITSMTTNASGVAETQPLLAPDTAYYLKETPPTGYAAEGTGITGPYYVEANRYNTAASPDITIYNTKLQTVKLFKVDESGDPIQGAVFKLYAEDPRLNTAATAIQTGTTDRNGYIAFTGLLPLTTYYVQEFTAPAGYVKDTQVHEVTTDNTGAKIMDEIVNIPQGRIKIKKEAAWTNAAGEPHSLPLEGAEFDIYPYDTGSNTRGSTVAGTLVTDDMGTATSGYLDPGHYELVERVVPSGFSADPNGGPYIVEVQSGATNTVYFDTPISNVPASGRFVLTKYASGTDPKTVITGGAEFKLYKETSPGSGEYEVYSLSTTSDTFVVEGTYVSGFIPEGNYRLEEVAAPEGYTLNPDPMDFTITTGKTIELFYPDDAQGSILLTKTGDAQNGSPLLEGAKFQLYRDGAPVGTVKTTDARGQAEWTHLDAGTYSIVETEAPTGYAVTADPIPDVTVLPQGTARQYTVSVSDPANMGRVKIVKQDAEDAASLEGAEFEIWSLTGNGQKDQRVAQGLTTNGAGFVLSGLLPADPAGTDYLVVETKAPTGYSLDDRLEPTEQIVKVKPIHQPVAGDNVVTFLNKERTDVSGFVSSISKEIVSTGDAKSLMLADFDVTFKLKDYTDGQNPLPLEDFTVTDTDILRQYLEQGEYKDMANERGAYRVGQVRVYGASSAENIDIDALVQYQTYDQLGTSAWTTAGTLQKLNELAEGDYRMVSLADLTDPAVAIRVQYLRTGRAFTAKGIEFDVTFAQQAEGPAVHEVRRVENTAALSYSYTLYDNTHTPVPVPVSRPSNTVSADLPGLERVKTEVLLTNNATNATGQPFVSGSPVQYRVTAKNTGSDTDFKDPIISIDIPAYTTLDESAIYNIVDSEGVVWTPSQVRFVDNVPATHMVNGVLQPLLDASNNPVMTRRMVFIFEGSTLAAGKSLNIDYQVLINRSKPSAVTTLFSPAYLSSAYRYPVTVDNPLGLSFDNDPSTGSMVENGMLDNTVDSMLGGSEIKDNLYVNANESITVVDDDALVILKRVKGALDSDFLNPGQRAYTYPNGMVDYEITVSNYSTDDASHINIVDILPFEGDSHVKRVEDTGAVMPRRTELPERPVLVDVSAPGATIYYCTAARWSAAQRQASGNTEDELPMLYENDSSAWAGWTTAKPADMTTVTAIGIAFDFGDQPLGKGESVAVYIKMQMPGFTADKIGQYYDKLIANSAAASLTTVGNTAPTRLVENDQVLCAMRLPVGSIGDYVWIDRNNDGLQDATDEPISGLEVTLYRTDHKAGDQQVSYTYTTATDTFGKYLFENLPCNLLKDSRDPASTNPEDYVGEVYTTYRVEFADPGHDLVPTVRYAGNDTALDSNIDPARASETLTLTVKSESGALLGENNLTIDAGFTQPCALGDFVWIDVNRNGIQDGDEPGVNGVTVNLYRLDENGRAPDAPTATTTTAALNGADGYYLFENLVAGDYVVEFDISELYKPGGYTYRYAFTEANQGASDVDDSDASITMDEDDRIRRTETITLASRDRDLTWDAGLTVYSALGGYCFDDRNYNDVQDLGVPLPGTKVTLYEVIDGIRQTTPLRPAVTVGEDGRYYFDNLKEGVYQVHFDFPDGYMAASPRAGGDPTLDSNVELEITPNLNQGYTIQIDLGYDTIDTTWDGGAYILGAIGDYVWFDEDKDGIQDENEKGIEGIAVTLQRREGFTGLWKFYEETTTDQAGYYLFEDLKTGYDSGYQYRVIFGPKTGMQLTLPLEGLDPTVDCDALPIYIDGLGFPTDPIIVEYGATDLTYDAGFIITRGALGDYVWFDLNRNGLQDEGEPGVAGIPVALEYNASGNLGQETAWSEIAMTTTNASGYYRFDDLGEGYYRIRFMIPAEYVVTDLEAGEDEDSYFYDSDAMRPAKNGWYYTRGIYLPESEFDMTWDAGIYQLAEGEEPPPPVNDYVKTGNPLADRMLWLALVGAGFLTIAALALRKRCSNR
ncbi:SpaA isopeptide-forming pilin-related protein [Gehongia tenuis]|uniref:Uncharacterized protein n=1 Tax=Gehongia tenuis TaxID=2763655 RepID=A0A926HPU0_9FIRM|nr:SpaA isopeptide-forming pilin-related protein [Gehongia tenuis]MBC8532024.1 hypothetical protein [Gehongia tenuis]